MGIFAQHPLTLTTREGWMRKFSEEYSGLVKKRYEVGNKNFDKQGHTGDTAVLAAKD
jgi:hypothetical protein